jgi:hypothetical protein
VPALPPGAVGCASGTKRRSVDLKPGSRAPTRQTRLLRPVLSVCDPGIADPEPVRRCLVEGRHILTRDRRLAEEWRVSPCTVLEEEVVEDRPGGTPGEFPLKLVWYNRARGDFAARVRGRTGGLPARCESTPAPPCRRDR